MDEFRLTSNLSRGMLTYLHFQGSEFTIDFCLTTERLTERILICKIVDMDHNSDHMPIEITLDLSIGQCSPSKRFNWDRLNQTKFEGILKQKFSNVSLEDATPKELDIVTTLLSEIIYNAILLSTPKTIISPRATPGFDEKCHETRANTSKARRAFQQTLTRGDDPRKALKD